jgi:hypothetical protein
MYCLLVETRMKHDAYFPMRIYNPLPPSIVIPDVLELEAWFVVRVATLIMQRTAAARG